MTHRVGQRLGNYRLVHLLGQGGFADVYLSKHVHLNTPAAVKVLHTHLSYKCEDSFRTEALTIANLVHPHIVRILDYGIEGGIPFLVMDYAPGGTVRELYSQDTLPSLAAIVSYVKQIASALQYAHGKKLIYRDVKPENILLGQHGEILLSDFGIALIAQSSHAENLQRADGTIEYMAPEQLQGRPRRASDQYALGVVVYEWLCGHCPFHGSFHEIASQHLLIAPPSLHEKVPTIPSEMEQVVMKALSKDPQQRFASIEAFANALEQAYLLSKEPSTFTSIYHSTQPMLPAIPKQYSPRRTRMVTLERTPPQPTLKSPIVSFNHISSEHTLRLPKVLSNHMSSEFLLHLPTDQSISIAESLQAVASPPFMPPGQISLIARLVSALPLTNLSNQRTTQPTSFFKKKAVFFVGLILLLLVGLLSPTLINLLTANAHPASQSRIASSNTPTLTLSSSNVNIGQHVFLHMSHFSPSARVFLTHDTQETIKVSGTEPYVTVGANGAADLSLPLDESWNSGFHTVQAEDITTHYTANATLHIASGPTRPAHLIIDANTLDLGTTTQGINTIQPLQLHNTGSGSITWAASSNQPWLMTSPQQGTLSDSQTITIGGERSQPPTRRLSRLHHFFF